jgi:hypothetical protein
VPVSCAYTQTKTVLLKDLDSIIESQGINQENPENHFNLGIKTQVVYEENFA